MKYVFEKDHFSISQPLFEKHLSTMAGQAVALLEIGSLEGRSATWMVDHVLQNPAASLDCVDLKVSDRLRQNIENTGRSSQVRLLEGKSREFLRQLPFSKYDFIYIDGSHSTVPVLEDAVLSFMLAKVGGIIAFDDYLWNDPKYNKAGTPKKAIDAFLSLYAFPAEYPPAVELIENGWQVWVRKIREA